MEPGLAALVVDRALLGLPGGVATVEPGDGRGLVGARRRRPGTGPRPRRPAMLTIPMLTLPSTAFGLPTVDSANAIVFDRPSVTDAKLYDCWNANRPVVGSVAIGAAAGQVVEPVFGQVGGRAHGGEVAVGGRGERVRHAARPAYWSDGQTKTATCAYIDRRVRGVIDPWFVSSVPNVEVDRVEERLQFELREDRRVGGKPLLREERRERVPAVSRAHRQRPVDVVVVVKRQADLLEVVDALAPPGGLARAWTAGSSSAIRTAMIAMTTSNSISVKPRRCISLPPTEKDDVGTTRREGRRVNGA